jgi:hypothetical protein
VIPEPALFELHRIAHGRGYASATPAGSQHTANEEGGGITRAARDVGERSRRIRVG